MAEVGLPEGIYQVAPGKGSEIGPELVDLADMIMFTGSTEVGKSIMARAADTLTPVSLELGGKDPMIVLRDADVERAANAAAFYSMQNGGQTCISVERVYVEAPIYDDFVARVAQKVGALRQGVPTAAGTVDVGAMTIPSAGRHRQRARRGREGGRRQGAGRRPLAHRQGPVLRADRARRRRPLDGGDDRGDVRPDAADHEGRPTPTRPIRLANDSPFGLAASVWSKDAARGEEVARRIESGAVCVNDAQINYLVLELPMGGWKTSGMGQRHGAPGIRKYTRSQSLLVTRLAPKSDLHMFPYKARTTNMLLKGIKLLYGRGKRD